MGEKTINGMHKSELVTLIKGTIVKVNAIDRLLKKTNSIEELCKNITDKDQEINRLYSVIFDQGGHQSKISDFLESAEATSSDIDSARSKILNENDGFLGEIENAHSQSLEKLRIIQDSYAEIEGNGTDSGIKIELTNLASNFNLKNEEINEAYDEIFNTEEENGESGSLEDIQNAQIKAEEKLDSIQDFYKKTFEDTDESESIQNKLDGFVSKFQEHSNEFTKLHNDIFGYTESDDDGEKTRHTGELSKTKDIFKKYQEKYEMLFNQIEGLLSGATTTSLSKNFDDKVEEYKVERKKWETRIFVFLISFFVVSIAFAFIVVFNDSIDKNTIYTVGMPIYTFGIWFMIFMGNRRAESRKLEESFKHKFVMAKSFVGYKKSITEMTDTDGKLMNIHMNNLLNAISKDSSKFFEIKGESHPVADLFKKTKNSENRTNKTQE